MSVFHFIIHAVISRIASDLGKLCLLQIKTNSPLPFDIGFNQTAGRAMALLCILYFLFQSSGLWNVCEEVLASCRLLVIVVVNWLALIGSDQSALCLIPVDLLLLAFVPRTVVHVRHVQVDESWNVIGNNTESHLKGVRQSACSALLVRTSRHFVAGGPQLKLFLNYTSTTDLPSLFLPGRRLGFQIFSFFLVVVCPSRFP